MWSSGVGGPSSSVGVVGDWYLDTETADAYQKTAADVWTKRVNLRGAKGEKGDAGEKGKAGIDGASWFTGAGAPAEALGSDGDLYLDTETGDVFKRKGLWAKLTNIRGLKGDPGKDGVDGKNGEKGASGTNGTNGANGANGAVWLTGAGAPEAAQGADGDLYLRTSNGDVFKKAAGLWGAPIANLTGPAGPKGTDGTSGGGGTTWTTGAGAPNPAKNNPGEGVFYLDTISGAVYKADGTTWAAIYTPAAAGAPSVQVDAKPSTNQPISSKVDGSTSTLVSFGAVNDQRASLTNGNTFNGTTFKVGNGGAGWYEVRAESRGVTSSGGASNNFPILYLDVNDAMGNTNTGAAAIGTYDAVGSHTVYRGHSAVARTVYLKAGGTVQIQAVAASNSVDAYRVSPTCRSSGWADRPRAPRPRRGPHRRPPLRRWAPVGVGGLFAQAARCPLGRSARVPLAGRRHPSAPTCPRGAAPEPARRGPIATITAGACRPRTTHRPVGEHL